MWANWGRGGDEKEREKKEKDDYFLGSRVTSHLQFVDGDPRV
jgi:hypothetical protein